ncbi:MAG: hypothetical protein H7315_16010 [Herminiimonas sp.]|nr:hypothetical protein [Herminiimonas sp.]
MSASVFVHLGVLTLAQGSLSFSAGPRQKGVPLPPVFIEVRLRPPEQVSTVETVTEPRPVAPDTPDMPDMALAKADAPKLLSPLPISIERIGSDAPPTSPLTGLIPNDYLPGSALSVRPKPLTEPQLILPPGWLEAFGQVKMTLYINASGKVDELVLLKTNLAPELHDAVRDAFLRIEFSPGELGGTTVASVMTIEVDVASSLGSRR